MKSQVASDWASACQLFDEYEEYGFPEIIGVSYDTPVHSNQNEE